MSGIRFVYYGVKAPRDKELIWLKPYGRHKFRLYRWEAIDWYPISGSIDIEDVERLIREIAPQIFDELLQDFITNVLPDIIDNRIYDILNEVLESRVTDIVNKILNDWISKNLRQYVYGYINDYLKGCPWATLPLSGSEYMWIFQDGQIRKLKISDLGGYIKPVDPEPPTPEIKGSFDDSFDNSFD